MALLQTKPEVSIKVCLGLFAHVLLLGVSLCCVTDFQIEK